MTVKRERDIAKVDPASTTALTAPQRALLAEALRRAEETRDVMEDALVSFGRWLLVAVFNDDASAALGDRSDNPVWLDMLHRAGGPTLRLSEKMLYVALHIAARDRRITDEAWRNLEPGRKEILLPLGDDGLMRKAAQHVSAMKLTQRATRAYVASLQAESRQDEAAEAHGAEAHRAGAALPRGSGFESRREAHRSGARRGGARRREGRDRRARSGARVGRQAPAQGAPPTLENVRGFCAEGACFTRELARLRRRRRSAARRVGCVRIDGCAASPWLQP